MVFVSQHTAVMKMGHFKGVGPSWFIFLVWFFTRKTFKQQILNNTKGKKRTNPTTQQRHLNQIFMVWYGAFGLPKIVFYYQTSTFIVSPQLLSFMNQLTVNYNLQVLLNLAYCEYPKSRWRVANSLAWFQIMNVCT